MTSRASRMGKLTGFGRAVAEVCTQYRPEKMAEINAITSEHKASLLSRGLGRSYGDAALNADGIVHMRRLDRILSFNKDSGQLTAEAGVTLADILVSTTRHGWTLPVVPGTKHVTLGGAIASNVHGKNHHQQGDFGKHVLSMMVRLADSERMECSTKIKPDLFAATIAGYGLTGIIEEATIQLMPIKSASIQSVTMRISDLDEMVDAFEDAKDQADYMVGWIDHFGKGESLGRGVFSAGRHMSADDGGRPLAEFAIKESKLSVPFVLPRPLSALLLNKYTMALYNRLRFAKFRKTKTIHIETFDQFFHPLDGIKNWWKLYGKRGFLQYQFLIPESEQMRGQLRDVLQEIQYGELFSYLAVIKYHGAHQGLLSFSKPGYSVALDFPNTPKVRGVLSKLSDEIITMGGQVYLSKDQLLSAEQAARMFGNELSKWQNIVRRLDPNNRFQSAMSKRLKLKPDVQESLL